MKTPVTQLKTVFLSPKTQNGACSLLPLAMGWETVAIQSWVSVTGSQAHKPSWTPIVDYFLLHLLSLSSLPAPKGPSRSRMRGGCAGV